MNSCCVAEDHFDISKVNAQSDGGGAVSGAFLAKWDQPLTAEFGHKQAPQRLLERSEARRLETFDAPTDFLEVLPVEANEIAEGLGFSGVPRD